MGVILILIGVALIGVFILIILDDNHPEIVDLIAIISLFLGIFCAIKGNQILHDNPEYRLWLKHEKLKEFKIHQQIKSIENQKKIWLWKRHKQLDDSIKSLNIK